MDKRWMLILVIGLTMYGCLQTSGAANPENRTETVPVHISIEDGSGKLLFNSTIESATNRTLWQLMQEERESIGVEYTPYSWGVFVTGLRGVQSNESTYWALYVNGNYSDKGVSDIGTDHEIWVRWKLERVEGTAEQ